MLPNKLQDMLLEKYPKIKWDVRAQRRNYPDSRIIDILVIGTYDLFSGSVFIRKEDTFNGDILDYIGQYVSHLIALELLK